MGSGIWFGIPFGVVISYAAGLVLLYLVGWLLLVPLKTPEFIYNGILGHYLMSLNLVGLSM